MINKEKIRLMSKLAIYEKNEGKIDNKLDHYYKSDYVYVNNWWTRISVGFAALIIIGWVLFYLFNIEGVDILAIDYKMLAIQFGIFFVALIILYSILSTYIYGKRYEHSQSRLNQYFDMLEQLDRLNQQNQSEGEDLEDYGSNISNSRIDDRLL